MNQILKNIVTKVLVWEAKFLLRKFKPKVVAVTGSVGKSSAKDAIALVLERKFKVRKSQKSYNSELGLALAILGLSTAWRSPSGWGKNIFGGVGAFFSGKFPQALVLEMGVDRPRDMDRLLKIARPDVAVVTAIGGIPAHVEFFAGAQEVAREKGKLVRALRAGGKAVLNFDDDTVYGMKDYTGEEARSFGFGTGADVRASDCKISKNGTICKFSCDGSVVPVRASGVFGRQHVYSLLAAAAVGTVFEMNLIETAEALSLFEPPPGRMRLIEGIKSSIVLDDSYNASPLATHAALDVLCELEAKRKIFVFGDMLEIGKFAIPAHKAAGQRAGKFTDYLVAVGPRAKFAAEEAKIFSAGKTAVECFSTSKEAAGFVKEIIKEGDLVLVKGSQATRMERVVEEIMAHPEDALRLLARQDKFWKNKE